MLVTLALGLLLWLSYGLMRGDFIIAAANGTSLCLVGVLLGFKWRDKRSQGSQRDDLQQSLH
jgi:MtN3 and saliva related transmembrane protein